MVLSTMIRNIFSQLEYYTYMCCPSSASEEFACSIYPNALVNIGLESIS